MRELFTRMQWAWQHGKVRYWRTHGYRTVVSGYTITKVEPNTTYVLCRFVNTGGGDKTTIMYQCFMDRCSVPLWPTHAHDCVGIGAEYGFQWCHNIAVLFLLAFFIR